MVVTLSRGCGKGLPQKHLLFCCSKRGNVLQQRFSLLRPFCVAVGGVAEFRPAILHFILKQLCCVVKSCLFVNGLTACKLCVTLPFGGKAFFVVKFIYVSCFNKQMPSSYLQRQRLSCYNLLYNVKCSAIQRCRRLFYGDCRDKHIQFQLEAGCR